MVKILNVIACKFRGPDVDNMNTEGQLAPRSPEVYPDLKEKRINISSSNVAARHQAVSSL